MECNERKQLNQGLKRLDSAIKQCNPSHVFALFSGGHDSLVATYIASHHPKFTAAVHINTGIGIRATREFVYKTCRNHGWKLIEYKAAENVKGNGDPDPQVYEELVLEYGFPGPTKFGHNLMYNRLKERQIGRLIREHKQYWNDKIILVSGCRSQESRRRMGHVKEIQVDGCRVWNAIIHDWSKRDVNEFIHQIGLKPNPVVELLCKSGECLCGAFAQKGELAELAAFFPKEAEYIRALEQKVMKRFPWRWEGRPPSWWIGRNRGKKKKAIPTKSMPLCMSCVSKAD